MEISLKADYALRAVLYIAQMVSPRPTITEIAEKEKIPREFLAKILLDLTDAGILKSFKGVKGGYQLARRPAQITMLEVIEAINGPVALNLCKPNQKLKDGTLTTSSLMYPLFASMERQLIDTLKKQTFAKFPARAKNR